jgi:RNA polymerase sigma-70 factor (ECF subfamily)
VKSATNERLPHHPDGVIPALPRAPVDHAQGASPVLTFDAIYQDYFSFVWRSARRLGVHAGALDDVVQEVFVIVHRRLSGFEGRSALRTWLFAITLNVARDHRRSAARKSPDGTVEPDSLLTAAPGPGESFERAEAVRLVYAILDGFDDERRELFVMAEFEQMPMGDIAALLGINVNTGYARLRAARQAFESAVQRRRISDEWRLR